MSQRVHTPLITPRMVGSASFAGISGQALDALVTPTDGLEHDAEVTVRLAVQERATVPPPGGS